MSIEQMENHPTTTSEDGIVSSTAGGFLARLFGHRISPRRLQTVDCPRPCIDNGCSDMRVCRQTNGRIQPVVVHCRNEYPLRHTAALSGAHDDDLRTSLQ